MIAHSLSGFCRGLLLPHSVNEVAARMVAGMVVLLSLAIILFDLPWLLFALVYGFLARVLTGPTLSPMGLLATRVLVPLLGNQIRPVAGPPKRFAQTGRVGILHRIVDPVLRLRPTQAAYGVLGVLLAFATLESVLGFCAGCFVFGYLMRWGFVPAGDVREVRRALPGLG